MSKMKGKDTQFIVNVEHFLHIHYLLKWLLQIKVLKMKSDQAKNLQRSFFFCYKKKKKEENFVLIDDLLHASSQI